MTGLEYFELSPSAFSTTLALFTIWFAMQQAKELQESYEVTTGILVPLNNVRDKAQLHISDTLQNLPRSSTDQQRQMLEVYKSRPTQEAIHTELIAQIAAEEPDSPVKVADAISEFQHLPSRAQATTLYPDALVHLAALGSQLPKKFSGKPTGRPRYTACVDSRLRT